MPLSPPPADALPPQPADGAPPPGTRLPSHFSGCFACGSGQMAGLHMAPVVGEGVSIHATFTVTESHQGAPGLSHGGVLATAVDEAMGFTLALLQVPAVTAHLEIDYRLPVPVGSAVTLVARATAREGRKIWTDVEGRFDDGRLAFTGSALFLVVPLAHFVDNAPAEIGAKIAARYNP